MKCTRKKVETMIFASTQFLNNFFTFCRKQVSPVQGLQFQ